MPLMLCEARDYDATRLPSGGQVVLYLIPAEESTSGNPEVVPFTRIGGGCPERAWHNRWLHLLTLPEGAVGSTVREALEAHTEDLEALAGLYEGKEWNGSNHVGSWAEGAAEACEALDLLTDAIETA